MSQLPKHPMDKSSNAKFFIIWKKQEKNPFFFIRGTQLFPACALVSENGKVPYFISHTIQYSMHLSYAFIPVSSFHK